MDYNLFGDLDFSDDMFNLTRYILTSEIRLNLLLSLYDSSKVLDEMRLDLNKKPGNLLRGLNELMEKELVIKYDKTYSLSSTGYLLTMNIINLFDNWDSINNHFDFWQKHSIDSFGSKFLKRIYLWKDAELIESNSIEFTKTFNVYCENLADSKEMNIVFPIFSESYIGCILKNLIKNNGTLNLITNEKIIGLIYESELSNTFDLLVKEEKIVIITTNYNLEIFFTVCDNFSSLFLFFEKMLFDDSEMLLIKEKSDIENAQNMFYYLKNEIAKE